jgi:hypothetical protein
MNKINIDDLEAIYFIDKVQMRSNSVPENKIPKLDFNVFQQQEVIICNIRIDVFRILNK